VDGITAEKADPASGREGSFPQTQYDKRFFPWGDPSELLPLGRQESDEMPFFLPAEKQGFGLQE